MKLFSSTTNIIHFNVVHAEVKTEINSEINILMWTWCPP